MVWQPQKGSLLLLLTSPYSTLAVPANVPDGLGFCTARAPLAGLHGHWHCTGQLGGSQGSELEEMSSTTHASGLDAATRCCQMIQASAAKLGPRNLDGAPHQIELTNSTARLAELNSRYRRSGTSPKLIVDPLATSQGEELWPECRSRTGSKPG
ncbi:unnamed protein product [Pleuronectes platessa]|uniref:Uncharacterized protein n=1 Tax=Pleuronectes platessa TaxID=8262 RepID=A0A9N7UB94_PLEPL|nr:unnamed protein product [Pleuronectes platessa]